MPGEELMPDRRTSVSLKDYLDAQLAEVRRAVATAAEAAHAEGVPLKQFFDAILDEQRRAVNVAEQEREKAASSLRIELERAIGEGDRNLRDHIEQQIMQIRAALKSADILELERVKVVATETAALRAAFEVRVISLSRELEITHQASETAIAKAEQLNKERWQSANEWRGQSADRERSQGEEMSKLASTFIRSDTAEAKLASVRDSADSQIADLRRQIQELSEKLGKIA